MEKSLNPVAQSINGNSGTERVELGWEMGGNGRGGISWRDK